MAVLTPGRRPPAGTKFGHWTTLGVPFRLHSSAAVVTPYCVCRCVCGTTRVVSLNCMRSGGSISCGCVHSLHGEGKRRHGLYKHGAYRVWAGMRARCHSETHVRYKDYGGRGISICQEWRRDPVAFVKWAEANGYAEGLEIDRIDNDGNYEPSNCRFVTPSQNCQNRRPRKKAVP